MARATKPSYTVEFPLLVNKREADILDKKMRIAKHIYNTCLGHALKRLKAVLADKNYRLAVKVKQEINVKLATIPDKRSKRSDEQQEQYEYLKTEQKEVSSYIRWLEWEFYGYSEFSMFKFVSQVQRKFKDNIGSLEAQEIATRAFTAVEKLHYHQANKVHFKRKDDDMSVANKNNKSGLRYVDGHIEWGDKLILDFKVKACDVYGQIALMGENKYVRILKREIRGKGRYFVQFVQVGYPPIKRDRDTGMEKHPQDTTGKWVGLDEGTSTLAIASEDDVRLVELAPECVADAKEIRRVERAMDRSKRANNPQNYNEDGTIKRGVKLDWHHSKKYLKHKAKRKDCHRTMASKRKQSHETLANYILGLGCDVRVETMNMRGLQKRAKKTTTNKKNGKTNKKKRYGKTLANRAPAMLITIIDRKLRYQGKSVKKINTTKVKASQFSHVTGEYSKKELNKRWNDNILGYPIQRDMYSAFLIGCTNDSLDLVDVNLCNQRWLNFLDKHNQEVARLQQSSNKTLNWYVKLDKKRTATAV